MNRRLFLRSAVAAGVSATAMPSLAAQFAALTQLSGSIEAVTGDRAAIEIERSNLHRKIKSYGIELKKG